MNTIEDQLEKTSTLAKTCELAVKAMLALQADMKAGKPVQFDSEIYHNPKNAEIPGQRKVCFMCVVGSIVRGFGFPDDKRWHLGDLIIRQKHTVYKLGIRLSVVDCLTSGVLILNDYSRVWENNDFNDEKRMTLIQTARDIYNHIDPDNFDIQGYIRLFSAYAKFFKEQDM